MRSANVFEKWQPFAAELHRLARNHGFRDSLVNDPSCGSFTVVFEEDKPVTQVLGWPIEELQRLIALWEHVHGKVMPSKLKFG